MPKDTFTKIVSTLGLRTDSQEMIEKLANAGTDVFRCNFSHGNHEEQGQKIDNIRAVAEKLGRPLAVLADMQGPKHRIGKFENEKIELKAGQKFRVYVEDKMGNEEGVQLPHPEVFASLKAGERVLLNDGKVGLTVTEVTPTYADTIVDYGNMLSDKKGFNLPDTIIKASSITEKDRKDLAFVMEKGVDFIALSFFQSVEDVREAKAIIGDAAKIIVKLEKPSAFEDLEAIAEEADVIMVARGDLAIESPLAQVPMMQREIVATCRRLGKPVIVATEMMETMTYNPRPTRAEASDVATAVYMGADAVMTSGETAAMDCAYPVETIETMTSIIKEVEAADNFRDYLPARQMTDAEFEIDESIALSASDVAELIDAKAIISYSVSGRTAQKISAYRPSTPIICITEDQTIANQMVLSWGVKPHVLPRKDKVTFERLEESVAKYCAKFMDCSEGDKIVVTAGKAASASEDVLEKKSLTQSTNFMTIVKV